MNGYIVKLRDGRWYAECNLRDDRVNDTFATEDEARRFVRDTERHENGNVKTRKRDVPAYEDVDALVSCRRPLR